MPVERKDLETDYWGTVEQQVIDILSDGRGYYFSELLAKTQCHGVYLRKVLVVLQGKGYVRGKSRANKQTGEWKVFFLADHMLSKEV